MTAINLTIPPASEPVSLAEVKAHSRVAHDEDDSYLTALIPAVRQFVEDYCRRSILTQTWEWRLDGFPRTYYAIDGYNSSYRGALIRMPRPPLQSLTSIHYDDREGTEILLPSKVYYVDKSSAPARISLEVGEQWPITIDRIDCVRLAFVAGYGDAAEAVPTTLRHALLMGIDHLYNHRGILTEGMSIEAFPVGFRQLIWPYREDIF